MLPLSCAAAQLLKNSRALAANLRACSLRRSAVVEAFKFVNAKICKIRLQYLAEPVHWSDAVKEVLNSIDRDVDKAAILRFVELLCSHLENRFPDDGLASN